MERDASLVLICGPYPPPFGGIATIISMLREARFRGVRYHIVDTRVRSRTRVARIRYAVSTAGRIVIALLRYRPAAMLSFSSAYTSFWEKAFWSFLGRLFGVRTAVVLVDGKFPNFERALSAPRHSMVQRILHWYTLVGVQSEQWRRYFSELAPQARYQIITGGVDASAFTPPPVRSNNGPPTLLFVGWLVPDKGIYDLINASAQLTQSGLDFRVRFVGPAFGREAEIQQAIDTAGVKDRVQLVGTVSSQAALIAEYRGADVFVLPTYYEGFPTVVLEAMASGLPVISTRVGAIPEIIEHARSGLLVPPREPTALAQAIAELLDNATVRREMGSAARERVLNRFTLSHSLASYQAFFNTLLQLPEPTEESVCVA